MPKPPKSTPHSDLTGVHRDEKTNIETSIEAGQDAGTLAKDQKRSVGYPNYSEDETNPEGPRP
ncbi:MAG TPA: hypothetical protein VGB70_05575 [Allosphingosinicella sp.]